jgi:acetolactate synthase-1/2/3 large subunit
MAQTTPTGAEVVARTLARAGVRRVFSLSGNQVLSLYESLDRAGVAIVHTRHEGAAVHMADAWARLTGEVGVCLVSAGPGHANALGALAVAGTGESAVLLLSGHAPLARAGQGAFQEMDQAGLARPLVRWAQVATSPAVLGAQVASALRAAQRGIPGPVHLSLPVDVLEAPAPAGPDAATDAAPDVGAGRAAEGEEAGEAAPPDGAAVRAVLDALSGAARPLILAGAAGGRPALHARLEALSARSGVPWLRVDHPRGLADPGLGRAAEAVAAADVLLLVGKRQDYRLGYAAPPVLASGVRLLQIDPEREAIGRHRPVEVAIVAGLLPALDALLAAAGDGVGGAGGAGGARSGPAAWAARVAALRAAPSGDDPDAAGDGAPGGGLHPWAVLGVLAAALDARRLRGRDVCLVVDGGEFGQWARARLRPAPPGDLVNEPSGAIGYALPFAVAAALARPAATVVALAGDGAFGFYALELETAARCAAPVLVVVGNDAAWGTERHLQLRRYGADRAVATDLLPARYDVLATALGGHGEHVEALDALRPALERALDAVAAGRPAVVDVRLRSVPSPAAGAL